MSPPGTTLANLSQGVVTDDPDGAGVPEVVQDDPEGLQPLLVELMDDIIGRLPMLQVLQLRPYLGSAFRNVIHRPAFRRNRPNSEGEFGPSYFMTDAKGDLHWHGFDTKLRKWTQLPSLNFAPSILPSLDPKWSSRRTSGYLMAGDGGLLCIDVGEATGREKLVICYPLTRTAKVLPPLNYARHPVLMHLKVDHDSGHYQVIVAGSVAGDTQYLLLIMEGYEELSLKTEKYDSKTGVWECPDGSDLPFPLFCLNEYQNIKDGKRELLLCVATGDTGGRGVLVYDILKRRWAQEQLHIPLVSEGDPNVVYYLAMTQILQCGGSVFVFSQQQFGRNVYFMIHKLIPEGSGGFTWDEVMKFKWTRVRRRRRQLIYREFDCVPVSEYELCIFYCLKHTLEIIDLGNPMEFTPVQYPSYAVEYCFTQNWTPMGFVFKPSFKSVVSPGRY